MKKVNVKVGRGSDGEQQSVLLKVGDTQVPLDPKQAEELADALKRAAHDVRRVREGRDLSRSVGSN